jgi:predicted metal-dependent hydrolase
MTEAGDARAHIDLEGRPVPVRLRRNRRARRLVLRIDGEGEGAVVTLPPGASRKEALDFARAKGGWILARLARLGARIPFADGAVLPILGEPHRVRHDAKARVGVIRDAGEIVISGREEHLARRLADWLKSEAKACIGPRAHAFAAALERKPGRITVRDTRTRWGSCSHAGNLSFCWRLILAPGWVLDYVVAHEVAHLLHPHHGPAFWRTVAALDVEADAARAWLRRDGEALRRYG